MNVSSRLSALSAFTVMLAAPLAAQQVDATDPGRLAQIIQNLGYKARVETDSIGDPMLASSAGGTDFSIYFYGCSDNVACKSVLFKVGYDLSAGTTLENVNEWNETSLFGRAYLDDDMDPWLEMAVNLDGGVSQANFEDTYDWWEVIIQQFEEHIDF